MLKHDGLAQAKAARLAQGGGVPQFDRCANGTSDTSATRDRRGSNSTTTNSNSTRSATDATATAKATPVTGFSHPVAG